MSKVFISYRVADSVYFVDRIYDKLAQEIGESNVFRDINTIPLGADFRTYIENALSECLVELVVIGPQWLEITNENGIRRLDDPQDLVRAEIEVGLSRDILIIPLLVMGQKTMPSVEKLPTSIAALSNRQATTIDREKFASDMTKLIDHLKDHLNKSANSQEITELTSQFEQAKKDKNQNKMIEIGERILDLQESTSVRWKIAEIYYGRGISRWESELHPWMYGSYEPSNKQLKIALKDITTAIRLAYDSEDLAHYYIMRSGIYKLQKDYTSEFADITRAIELKPEENIYYLYRGRLSLKLGDIEAAKRDFKKAKKLGNKEAKKELETLSD